MLRVKLLVKQIFCKHDWQNITYIPIDGKILHVEFCKHCEKVKIKETKAEVRKNNRKGHNKNIKFSL